MTLDELLKQADSPTPEYVQELNKYMHEQVTGVECAHIYEALSYEEQDNDYEVKCQYCGDYHGCVGPYFFSQFAIPDYTKPENFWPLLWEIWDKCKVERYWDFNGNPIDKLLIASRHFEIIADPGIAGCLAYLKIKEEESEKLD